MSPEREVEFLPRSPGGMTRAGWLALANGTYQIASLGGLRLVEHYANLDAPRQTYLSWMLPQTLFMCLPLLPLQFIVALPVCGPSPVDIGIQATVMGVNTMAWGYAIAWIWAQLRRRFNVWITSTLVAILLASPTIINAIYRLSP